MHEEANSTNKSIIIKDARITDQFYGIRFFYNNENDETIIVSITDGEYWSNIYQKELNTSDAMRFKIGEYDAIYHKNSEHQEIIWMEDLDKKYTYMIITHSLHVAKGDLIAMAKSLKNN